MIVANKPGTDAARKYDDEEKRGPYRSNWYQRDIWSCYGLFYLRFAIIQMRWKDIVRNGERC